MSSPTLFPSSILNSPTIGMSRMDIVNVVISALVFSVFISFSIYFIINKEESKNKEGDNEINK